MLGRQFRRLILQRLTLIEAKIDCIAEQLARLDRKETVLMDNMDTVLDKMRAEKTVVDSMAVGVKAAVAKLGELRALIEDPAKIQEALALVDTMSATLDGSVTELGTAVATGTAADTETPPA